MNRYQKLIIGIYFAFTFLSCNQGNKESIDSLAVADSISNGLISSTAAVENEKDTARRFIRTADLKFKVKSVIRSTYDIEDITSRQEGFVTYTNLTSNINNVINTPISTDSSLETTYYTVTNSITLRIPNTKLDTTLKEISNNIDYLDYRIIKAEDVSLQILANNLTQIRSSKNEERLTKAIDKRGKRLNETTVAEDILSGKQEQADNAKISNLSLNDQIKYSTINLTIYQRSTFKRELIANDKNIDAYEPSFGTRFLEALKYGWGILMTFIVFLANFWAFLLLGVSIYFMYRRLGKKIK